LQGRERGFFPDPRKLFAALALAAGLAAPALADESPATGAAAPKTEIGQAQGASYRIDVPANWNGGLVLYFHGYMPVPATFAEGSPPPAPAPVFLSRGYAVAQSGYSAGGWAIDEALRETEALRRHFAERYGKPKETWVTGHSLGGFLTLVLLETSPGDYDGGLALCGPLAPSSWFMARRVFDVRVVFDYLFPGLLPSPADVPRDFQVDPARVQKVLQALQSNPEKAAEMRRYAGVRTDPEMASVAVFFTSILADLQRRGGGNPFDNRGTLYQGTSDDIALNRGVARYAGSDAAAEWLRKRYTVTGHLTKPVLAIATVYDPLIPAWVPDFYATALDPGSDDLFLQRWVEHDGHCAISPEETGRGFDDLVRWKHSGTRPPHRPPEP
jgi:pimeloyl-ACP methyl ester carboxylesterase